MTNHADLIARLRRSLADTSQEFDAFVASYTGRDTAYHERNQTTGLAFARACWDAALGAIANEAAEALARVAQAESERYAPLMQAVEWLLDDGHMNQEHLARLRAAFEAAERDLGSKSDA